MSPDPVSFALACLVMATGIGVDVALATIGRFHAIRSPSDGLGWVGRITATHILFPMIGYYGFVFATRAMEALAPFLGLAAGAMVLWFLKHAVAGWLEHAETTEEQDIAEHFGWAVVFAVSIDALWSGPAKSAQVIGWLPLPIAVSFPISGLIVGLIGLASAPRRSASPAPRPSPRRSNSASSAISAGLPLPAIPAGSMSRPSPFSPSRPS